MSGVKFVPVSVVHALMAGIEAGVPLNQIDLRELFASHSQGDDEMAFSKEDEAGTIYQNTSSSGKEFLKITIKGQKFVAFRNGYKKEDKHPDWNVYIDKPRDGDQRHGIEPMPARPITSSDVPF